MPVLRYQLKSLRDKSNGLYVVVSKMTTRVPARLKMNRIPSSSTMTYCVPTDNMPEFASSTPMKASRGNALEHPVTEQEAVRSVLVQGLPMLDQELTESSIVQARRSNRLLMSSLRSPSLVSRSSCNFSFFSLEK